MSDVSLKSLHISGSGDARPETTSIVPRWQSTSSEIVRLAEQISALFMNAELSDVTLIVEGQSFPVHRVVLAARSDYFKAMFFSGMQESTATSVELKETPADAFRILLKYIYTAVISLDTCKIDLVFDILGLVHKYGFVELEKAVSDHLQSVVSLEKVCDIYTVAQMYSMQSLASFALDKIDAMAEDVVRQSNFSQLPFSALLHIISRDSFYASEIEIFRAVARWMEANPEESASFPLLVAQVRLQLIKLDDLLTVVRPSGLVDPDHLLDVIREQTRTRSSELVLRGFLLPNVNVATSQLGAGVLAGDGPKAFFEYTHSRFEGERCMLKHRIGEPGDDIIIELGRPFIINFLKIQLPDREQRSFSYAVEVSVDRHDWVRVIDHSKYACRSLQNLLFKKRVVKYIRICGTAGLVHNQTFQIAGFEAMFMTDDYRRSHGLEADVDPATKLLISKSNVATVPNNALVIEGVSRLRNALLNGFVNNYDWDNGYTCHQLGSGNITVQLPQPYLIDSVGLLLWDLDDRTYSYFIEVSCDQTTWTKVVEENDVRSWRVVSFPLQPVVFIKIVGTHNSANEVFHCVHFECPASSDILKLRAAAMPAVAFSSTASARSLDAGSMQEDADSSMSDAH